MGRLILIEGMIGAGKTSTATHIANWLAERGEDVCAYHELADDHPIRTRAVDLLRAAYAAGSASQTDVGAVRLADDLDIYALQQWGELAERVQQTEQTIVLESSFLQNSVLPTFVNDAPIDMVRAVFARIETQIAPVNPLLIYLRPSETERAVRRVHDVRGEPWASFNMESVSNYPWAKARGLSGRVAVVGLYQAWEHVVDELLALYSSPQLLIIDPQNDWADALRRVHSELRGEGPSVG